MSSDQLDLLGFTDAVRVWVPTTPPGRKPANEYELFLALKPDAAQCEALIASTKLLQQHHGTPTAKWLKPSLWHVTLLELGKFTGSYSRNALDAIEAACESVTRSSITIAHESLVSFQPSHAGVLTCSEDATQRIAQLRHALVAALRGRSIKCKPASTPHMTLFYDREHHLPMTPLDQPVNWIADGFSLLCSHKGLGHHEVVRSWPTSPP